MSEAWWVFSVGGFGLAVFSTRMDNPESTFVCVTGVVLTLVGLALVVS